MADTDDGVGRMHSKKIKTKQKRMNKRISPHSKCTIKTTAALETAANSRRLATKQIPRSRQPKVARFCSREIGHVQLSQSMNYQKPRKYSTQQYTAGVQCRLLKTEACTHPAMKRICACRQTTASVASLPRHCRKTKKKHINIRSKSAFEIKQYLVRPSGKGSRCLGAVKIRSSHLVRQ